ncbi:pyridoxamine 5'-phosphate oxidase family protein [Nocardia sp. NPDC048505]|uniref:pyridoxamine 5'-phosphate oxidase family protein n=1 Tax=Nocardia sp. NPDC048505 TaxID=3155756 RepID=UPI0033D1B49B
MKAKNLDDSNGMRVQEWETVTGVLDSGITQAPDTGGPNRYTTWLTTINGDETPHVTPVGAAWVDGVFWFQTGDTTQKAKNIARDPRSVMSVSAHDFDLVVEGVAEKVDDAAAVARVAAVWAEGGWPCAVDESGIGLTAPFNAPAVGPAPWRVYRITPRSAVSVSTVEPGGTTRWTFTEA